MPFTRPTFAQISARVKTDIQGALEGTAAFFRSSFERAARDAITGVSHHLHGHLDWIARQLDPRSADDDILETVHGEPFGVFRHAPVATRLTATDTGTNGTIVVAGTAYVRADGQRYLADADATVASGTVTIALTADIDVSDPDAAGEDSNCDNGTELDIESPIAGLDGVATITATTTTGSDQETIEDYFERVLDRKQNPISGGGPGDYRQWMLEVSGVTRAWEYPRVEGFGTVTIYGVNDDDDPITLTAPKLTEIEDYLDQPGRKPSLADAIVRTPALVELDPEINISPDTTAVRNAIIASINEFLLREASPGTGDGEDSVVLLSQLNEAISLATGEIDHELVSPAANVTIPFGSLAVIGTPTWGAL